MSGSKPISPPTRKELRILRFLIILGLFYMVLFFRDLISTTRVEFEPLFWMLIFVLVFNCLTVVHEWIHYLYISVPPTPPKKKTYTVDIFTTFCAGEPYSMIVETLTAIQKITYPHTAYLCDEADDPYLKEVCRKLNVKHVTRTVKVDAKAGNINNALRQSNGELCVVLDPDHVPVPEFLDPIVSHFDNPEVGFVQIVQTYKNYQGNLIAKGAAQQTFQFYGPMMMTMNKYGTVLAIGANCTFRRKALDSIGGHAAGLAEDMNTAMHLHAAGWKSVYVPSVLARGLVPDTLSAYYSQQLKWSRGVFELFVTSYFKLFRKFSWKQKIHYGVIPIHYLSGLVFLLNFSIPVISLLFNVSPINLQLEKFAIIGFPLGLIIIVVRHYVQTWVMEDEERGFHFVGGLLMIGTWWVFIVGLVYTIIRKKVPYVPTPKDSNEDNNWYLNIPNISVIVISLIAICWGLSYDWSPYTLIMSGFAFMNCLVLSFCIAASRQLQFRRFKTEHKLVYRLAQPVSFVKNKFWKARHRIYKGSKSVALPVAVSIICLTLYSLQDNQEISFDSVNPLNKGVMQSGIFAPQTPNGLSAPKLINHYSKEANIHFDIVSFYIAWGNEEKCFLPVSTIDSVYQSGSIPLITWEPWQALFKNKTSSSPINGDRKVFSRIIQGEYDHYLLKFSGQIKALQRPVYLRFAHEADNPAYPWSSAGGNTSEEFKAAWRYVHTYFERMGVTNVAWVWNPWKAEAVKRYFPGKDYVDWIGVTSLNYGKHNPDSKQYSMEELYQPFHKQAVFRSGLPVMLAEFGTLGPDEHRENWYKDASTAIKKKFPEVKAFVLFNTYLDKNTIGGDSVPYDWRQKDPQAFTPLFSLLPSESKTIPAVNRLMSVPTKSQWKRVDLPANLRGVTYSKGKTWYKNNDGFTKDDLLKDLQEMKQVGVNTVRWYGPSVYDRNFLRAINTYNLNIHYSFWMPDQVDFISGTDDLKSMSDEILAKVKDLKENKAITAWNLSNDIIHNLRNQYFKPELLYQQQECIKWLRALIIAIKKEDPARPVTIDVIADKDLRMVTDLLRNSIPEIDCYGLVLGNTKNSSIKELKVNYFYSKITAAQYLELPKGSQPGFIANWQDEDTKDYVSLDGLKDKWGRHKFDFYRLGNRWSKISLPKTVKRARILLPAMTTIPGTTLTYNALIDHNRNWVLAEQLQDSIDLKLTWTLVKEDRFGNTSLLRVLGTGPSVDITIPEKPDNYRVCLYVSKGPFVQMIKSKLNTPLY